MTIVERRKTPRANGYYATRTGVAKKLKELRRMHLIPRGMLRANIAAVAEPESRAGQ